MNDWRGKVILLGVTGGVAIYKSVHMCSRLTQMGAHVDVVMTPAAREFIAPLLFAAVSRRRVHVNPWEADRQPGHIALAESPDAVVIAPATANTLAKIAHGIADNLLTSVVLATKKPVLLAPAMNSGMWTAPATRDSMRILAERGFSVVGPGSGYLACGAEGEGRMAEPEDIVRALGEILFGAAS